MMINIGRTISVISGTRIYIRDRTPEDLKTESMYYNDPELLALDPPVSISFSCAYYSIITIDNIHIGCVSAYGYTQDEFELGVRIWDRNYWDKGYGAEAINTFCYWAFLATPIKRILAKTPSTNIRALRCNIKCGFVEYGRVMMGGYNMILMKKERQNLLGLGENI
jgi:RimJ/RimL family protein N-acetyltransferase